MKLINSESNSSSTENDFREFMQRGDDFYKIELLRQARSWYNKALQLSPDNKMVKSCISECDRKLAFENKVTYLLVSIAMALVLGYVLFYQII